MQKSAPFPWSGRIQICNSHFGVVCGIRSDWHRSCVGNYVIAHPLSYSDVLTPESGFYGNPSLINSYFMHKKISVLGATWREWQSKKWRMELSAMQHESWTFGPLSALIWAGLLRWVGFPLSATRFAQLCSSLGFWVIYHLFFFDTTDEYQIQLIKKAGIANTFLL